MLIPNQFDHAILAFGMPGGTEWIILLILGLLIFGRRLPEVGKSLGRGIVEFKKGIKGIDDEIEEASSTPDRLADRDQARLSSEQNSAQPAHGVSGAGAGGEVSSTYARSGDDDRAAR